MEKLLKRFLFKFKKNKRSNFNKMLNAQKIIRNENCFLL